MSPLGLHTSLVRRPIHWLDRHWLPQSISPAFGPKPQAAEKEALLHSAIVHIQQLAGWRGEHNDHLGFFRPVTLSLLSQINTLQPNKTLMQHTGGSAQTTCIIQRAGRSDLSGLRTARVSAAALTHTVSPWRNLSIVTQSVVKMERAWVSGWSGNKRKRNCLVPPR